MTIPRNPVTVALLVIVPLLALRAVSDKLKVREDELAKWDAQRIAVRDTDWAQEKSDHEKARKIALAKNQSTRQAALEAVCGGPEMYVLKNPDYAIWQMLDHLARTCVPVASNVTVRVDRFIEFEMTVQLSRAPTRNELGVWTQDILKHAGQYIYGLRYAYQDTVVASMDRQMIESVADWSAISPAEISSRMLDDVSPPEYTQTATTQEPPNPASETEAVRNFQDAVKRFNVDENTQLHLINDYRNRCAAANNWSSFSDLWRLRAEEQKLIEADKAFESTRAFFENVSGGYEQRLLAENVDPQTAAIAVRGFRQKQENLDPAIARLLKAATAFQASMYGLFQSMEGQWGSWKAYQEGQQIRFTFQTTQAQAAYLAASKKVAEADKEYKEATQNWTQKMLEIK